MADVRVILLSATGRRRFLTGVAQSHAAIVPAMLFSDHAVLQRSQTVPIWGTAEKNESVTVRFGDESQHTTADMNGRWSVQLSPMPATGFGRDLTIVGNETVTIHDVIVGDVWLVSGQSNMAFKLSQDLDAAIELPAAQHAGVRQFYVERTMAETPATTVHGGWSVPNQNSAKEFSAVAWYFATALQRALDVPVGIVNATWGNTPIEAWLPREIATSLPSGFVATDPYQANAVLFNGMIHPLRPTAVKGILWYQGESNVGHAREYRAQFAALISAWRTAFSQPGLPFYWVQLPRFRAEDETSTEWAQLREAQAAALNLPATGQAVALDLGDFENIHPASKREVGLRLARLALHRSYKLELVDAGPEGAQITFQKATARVSFAHGAEGLHGVNGALREFSVAGSDQIFHAAEAKLEKNAVLVSSSAVPAPVAVRYAWRNAATAELFNRDGLPAAPFRSDDW